MGVAAVVAAGARALADVLASGCAGCACRLEDDPCGDRGQVGRPSPPDVHVLEKVPDAKAAVLEEFQELLRATHKAKGNWTRDRGETPVPANYNLVSVERNQNTALWRQYVQARSAVQKECASRPAYKGEDTVSSRPPFHALGKSLGVEELAKDCNEWFLFHGATREACEGICKSGFQMGLAGTGATFQTFGRPKRPLYGWGAYFAEMLTKSDEYAREVGTGQFCVLVCRVVGGMPLVVTEDTITEQVLKDEVIHGPHHSVLGDRTQKLGKPYREVVVYNSEQIFPEFLVTYQRL